MRRGLMRMISCDGVAGRVYWFVGWMWEVPISLIYIKQGLSL